jgi:hypothetical protein
MDDTKKILAESEELVAKGVSMSDIGTSANTLQAPQNLADFVTTIRDLNTPLYNVLRKVRGFGEAASFNLVRDVFSTGDSQDASYTDGGLPAESTTGYGQVSYLYRQYGAKGKVTGLSQAVMAQFDDLKRREIANRIKFTLQRLNRDMYWGRTADTSKVIGLDELITTNVIDAGGAVLDKDIIDEAAIKIAYRGGQATHMFVSPGVKQQVNRLYDGSERVVITRDVNNQTDLAFGNSVSQLETTAGMWSVVSDIFVNPPIAYEQGNSYSSSSGEQGVGLSTIFIINEPSLEISELMAMTYEDLAKTTDADEFFVKTYVALCLYAEPFCAKIINVKDKA